MLDLNYSRDLLDLLVCSWGYMAGIGKIGRYTALRSSIQILFTYPILREHQDKYVGERRCNITCIRL